MHFLRKEVVQLVVQHLAASSVVRKQQPAGFGRVGVAQIQQQLPGLLLLQMVEVLEIDGHAHVRQGGVLVIQQKIPALFCQLYGVDDDEGAVLPLAAGIDIVREAILAGAGRAAQQKRLPASGIALADAPQLLCIEAVAQIILQGIAVGHIRPRHQIADPVLVRRGVGGLLHEVDAELVAVGVQRAALDGVILAAEPLADLDDLLRQHMGHLLTQILVQRGGQLFPAVIYRMPFRIVYHHLQLAAVQHVRQQHGLPGDAGIIAMHLHGAVDGALHALDAGDDQKPSHSVFFAAIHGNGVPDDDPDPVVLQLLKAPVALLLAVNGDDLTVVLQDLAEHPGRFGYGGEADHGEPLTHALGQPDGAQDVVGGRGDVAYRNTAGAADHLCGAAAGDDGVDALVAVVQDRLQALLQIADVDHQLHIAALGRNIGQQVVHPLIGRYT